MNEAEPPDLAKAEGAESAPVETHSQEEFLKLMATAEEALGEGRLDEAETLCATAIRLDPRAPHPKVLKANIAFRKNQSDMGIVLLREALRDDPDSHILHRDLAMRLWSTGKIDQALVHCQRLIELRPDDFEALEYVGMLYSTVGRYDEARACLEKAISLNPQQPTVYLNLGNAFAKEKRWPEAIEAYEKAISLAPEFPPPFIALGHVMRVRGDLDASSAHFFRAYELEPETPRGLKSLAKSQVDRQDYDGAVESLLRVVSLNPNDDDAYGRLGAILQRLGRFQEARGHFERAIQLNPRMTGLYCSIVRGTKMTSADRPMIEKMALLARSDRLRVPDRITLHFALGKALDDLGEYKDAIRHFDEANGMALHTRPTERDSFFEARAAATARVVQTFTKEFFAENESVGLDSSHPIILVGMPHSGIDLMEQILASHPEIGTAGKTTFWLDSAKEVFSGPKRSLSPGRTASLAREFDKFLEESAPGKRFVVASMPEAYTVLGEIHLAFPKARIIHCRRNPLDLCLSNYMFPNAWLGTFANDRANIVYAYTEYSKLMDHWRAVLPGSTLFEMDYEDIAVNAESAIRRLIEFIGLGWSDACLSPKPLEGQAIIFDQDAGGDLSTCAVGHWRNYGPWLGDFASLAPEGTAR